MREKLGTFGYARPVQDSLSKKRYTAAIRPSLAMMKSVPAYSGASPGRPRYPLDPSAIAQFLWRDNGLIPKVGVSRLDHASDPMDLVAAMVGASGLAEHAIFGEDLIDCCPSTARVVFTEDIFKITDEQGRYAARWCSSQTRTCPTALHQTSVIVDANPMLAAGDDMARVPAVNSHLPGDQSEGRLRPSPAASRRLGLRPA